MIHQTKSIFLYSTIASLERPKIGYDTIRYRIIQRAGRLSRPRGKLTLNMNANEALWKDLLHFLDVLKKAA
jgi:hypothetical protein